MILASALWRHREFHRIIRPRHRARLVGIDLVLVRPLPHPAEIPTLVHRAEIRVRVSMVLDPIHRNEADIRITHDLLPEQIRTVV